MTKNFSKNIVQMYLQNLIRFEKKKKKHIVEAELFKM